MRGRTQRILSAAVCFHRGGKILLGFHGVKRGWEFPGGRHEGREKIRETARRESWEEARIEPDLLQLQNVGYVEGENPEGQCYLTMIFACPVPEGIEPEPRDGMVEYKWFEPRELERDVNPRLALTPGMDSVWREWAAQIEDAIRR